MDGWGDYNEYFLSMRGGNGGNYDVNSKMAIKSNCNWEENIKVVMAKDKDCNIVVNTPAKNISGNFTT